MKHCELCEEVVVVGAAHLIHVVAVLDEPTVDGGDAPLRTGLFVLTNKVV